jgi:hypothetical protein
MVISVPFNWPSTVNGQLTAAGASGDQRRSALALMSLMTATLEPQSYKSSLSLLELATQLGMDPRDFADVVRLLGKAGAVALVRTGSSRRLAITPANRPRQRGMPRRFPDQEIQIRRLEGRGPLVTRAKA